MFGNRADTKYEELPQQEGTSSRQKPRKDNRSTYLNLSLACNLAFITVALLYGWRVYTIQTTVTENTLPVPPSIYCISTPDHGFFHSLPYTDKYLAPANSIVRFMDPKPYDAEIFQTNRWRGPAGVNTAEIDLAWSDITEGSSLYRLDEEDLSRLNKADDDPLRPLHKVADEFGGGYIAQFEVFHLLHCLVSNESGPCPFSTAFNVQ
jgi:hypothetical protein